MKEAKSDTRSVQVMEIEAGREGQRIDNFLLSVLKGVPRSHIYRLLRTGQVRVNKGRIKPTYRLNTGDQVRLPPVNYAGQSGPTAAFGSFNTGPKWQGNAFVTYSQGPFTGTIQARYVGPGRYLTVINGETPIDPSDPGYSNTLSNSISDNSVSSAVYINLAASFDITKEVQVFGSLNNAFDKDPVIAPGGNGFPTNPVYFDTYGRTFRIGARVKL